MSRTQRLALVVALAVPSVALAAPSRAWTAAKKAHIDAPIIAGIDMASAKASDSFKQFYPSLLAIRPEIKDVLDKLATGCKFDPFVAIGSVVAVVDDADDNRGAFYIALKGWDSTKLGACAKKLAKAENKELKIGAVKKGIQQLELKGKDDALYIGWIGKDVLVVTSEPSEKALLEQALGSKGTGEANRLVSKVDTGSTLWAVVVKTQTVQPGIEMKALYATVKVASGNIASDLRVVTGDTAQATNLVTTVNKELPKLGKGLPKSTEAMLKTLQISSSGPEVSVTANTPEKDAIGLLMLLML